MELNSIETISEAIRKIVALCEGLARRVDGLLESIRALDKRVTMLELESHIHIKK